MSSQEEDRKSESGSGEESGGGFGWVTLGVTTALSGFIGALLTFLYLRERSTEGPQCNVSAGPSTSTSTSANTGNETFQNRPRTCEPCGICLDDIQLVVTLPCGHRFHANCVERWIQDSGTCPTCRMKIRPDQMNYSV